MNLIETSSSQLRHVADLLWILILFFIAQSNAEEFSPRLDGDIGLGTYYTHSIIRGKVDEKNVLPYLDFDYARMFARIDTMGIKTVALGNGNLELVGRISQDGFSTNTSDLLGIENRKTPIPLGIGTLQITSVGGFVFNAFHDVRRSQGNLIETIYAGEFDLPRVTFYPMVGIEYESGKYVRYYYGISTAEAINSQYPAYQPAGTLNKFVGLISDINLNDTYHLNCHFRRKWLGDSIQFSPIVNQKYQDTAYLALSYRFK
jgi:outer membrane protein